MQEARSGSLQAALLCGFKIIEISRFMLCMSPEIFIAPDETGGLNEKLSPRSKFPEYPGAVSILPGPVQKVWCAPMSDAGEWVITWTRVGGAKAYEAQTSIDGQQWSSASRFSGTRAVVVIGPATRCWVRVRAVGLGGAGPWSPPAMGERAERHEDRGRSICVP